ncbi:MAG: hypothetical protein GC181_03880 [Bacteroidetes bacterium]|nr:hypothetical protein [Bacteroidota bacterium]
MKYTILFVILQLVVKLANSQSYPIDTNSVELYQQYTAGSSDYLYYEKNSETPFSGILISKTKRDKIFIEFRDGKLHGNYVILNSKNDTLQITKFDEGLAMYTVDYTYDTGKPVKRIKNKKLKGSQQDYEIFGKALRYVQDKKFNELNAFLNPLHSDYETTFTKLGSIFGILDSFQIKEIINEKIEVQNCTYMLATIELYYKKEHFTSEFLIKKFERSIRGEGFIFKAFVDDLIPDTSINDIMSALQNQDLKTLIQYAGRDYGVENKINNIQTVDSSFVFIDCALGFMNEIQLIKHYLININGEDQLLALSYKILDGGNLQFQGLGIHSFRTKYIVKHNIY